MSTLWCTARQSQTLSCSSGALLAVEGSNIIWEFGTAKIQGALLFSSLFYRHIYAYGSWFLTSLAGESLLYSSF